MEYVLIDNASRVRTTAQMMKAAGARGAKHYAEHADWGEMQHRPNAAIDFKRLDSFVREFQSAGIDELIICLRSNSSWASRQYSRLGSKNPTPKPEHVDAYIRWIAAVVERYDADGQDDMPGLRRAVRYYEIGSEWSSYEPESPDEYLAMLQVAYKAAHGAFAAVQVAHAAFLTTNAFDKRPGPLAYPLAFAAVDKRIMHHSLADMRKILDRGDVFDLVNLHSLGDPTEIEPLVDWVRWEMKQRGYDKPILISDTATTPFAAWGPATECRRGAMAILVLPATEGDRCRLAAHFKKLVDGDEATLRWTQGFSAADVVQRVVVAAERGVVMISTAFVEDLGWFKLRIMRAGTGNSAWAGFVDPGKNERRAGFFALQQVATRVSGATVRRMPMGDARVRLYEIRRDGGGIGWIAWLEAGQLLLPGDPVPSQSVKVSVGAGSYVAETTITQFGQDQPDRTPLAVTGGEVMLTITPTPVFIDARP